MVEHVGEGRHYVKSCSYILKEVQETVKFQFKPTLEEIFGNVSGSLMRKHFGLGELKTSCFFTLSSTHQVV